VVFPIEGRSCEEVCVRKRYLGLFRFVMTGWGAVLCFTLPAQAADGQTAKAAVRVAGDGW
jgi:hypothetical protein